MWIKWNNSHYSSACILIFSMVGEIFILQYLLILYFTTAIAESITLLTQIEYINLFQVLIETLTELGAQVRWSACNIYSTQVNETTLSLARSLFTTQLKRKISLHLNRTQICMWDWKYLALRNKLQFNGVFIKCQFNLDHFQYEMHLMNH